MTAVDFKRYELRRAEPGDATAVLELMRLSLGWQPHHPNEALFAWKHEQNVFGRSPAWVAVQQGEVIGFRTFMRWQFDDGVSRRAAVRAVDTATHPSHQGKGIFRALTLAALDDLRAEGVELVFNTPNDQSRPGYLKMGWRIVGRLPVGMRPRDPLAAVRTARARVPAELWSQPSGAGDPAPDVLAYAGAARLLAGQEAVPGMRTARSIEFLRWRYGLRLLNYRALVGGSGVDDGLVVFRVRRRGPATECAIVELLVPPDGEARRAALIRAALKASRADYVVGLRSQPAGLPGTLPLRAQGPLLVWRPVDESATVPALESWRLGLGDIELF